MFGSGIKVDVGGDATGSMIAMVGRGCGQKVATGEMIAKDGLGGVGQRPSKGEVKSYGLIWSMPIESAEPRNGAKCIWMCFWTNSKPICFRPCPWLQRFDPQ